MAGYKFNYETKLWGGDTIRLSPIYFRATRLFRLLKVLASIKGKLLDVGCATGDFPEAIEHYRPDLKIYGIDISKKAVNIARKRMKKGEFRVASAEKLPYPDNYFDVVTCFDVLEHVQYPEKAIREAHRVLKPGGLYHVYIPTEGNVYTPEGFLIKLGWKAKEIYGAHPQHYSSEQVRAMFEKNHFAIRKMIWGDHVFQQLLEIGYFSMLSLRGKNSARSVEGFLSVAKPSLSVRALQIMKNIFSVVSNTESRAFPFLPGLGVHVSAYKV